MESYLKELRAEVEAAIKAMDLPEEPANLYDPVRYILDLGGKRIRPVLCLVGCSLLGKPHGLAIHQALAVEVFHNFTLLHDDIMDSAALRRNRPTVHQKWNNNIAILSGDAMMVKAYQCLMMAPQDKLPKLATIFSETAMQVCEGQQLDMDYAGKADVRLDQYIEMIRLKTAVLLGCAMQLGAVMGGAGEQQLDGIRNFAEYLGIAFQIKDDYLDSFGDEAVLGKAIGGDIREGKRTWLTIKAYEMADVLHQQRLNDAFSNAMLDLRIETVLEVYNELGIKDHALAEIQSYSTMAIHALDGLNGEANVKAILQSLTHELIGRNA